MPSWWETTRQQQNWQAPALREHAIQAIRRIGEEREAGVSRMDAEIINEHVAPRIGDRWFNEGAAITLAGSASRSTVVSFQVPAGFLGIFRAFATALENAADWDLVTWAVEVGGHPVPGFELLRGPISDILYPVVIIWPVFRRQLVRIVASNSGTLDIENVTAMIRGTYFIQ